MTAKTAAKPAAALGRTRSPSPARSKSDAGTRGLRRTASERPAAATGRTGKSIINRTRDTILHQHPRWCVSAWSQMIGLMFTKPGPHHCLIFPFLPARVARMHMWFVFAPIDIVCLDGKGIVVATKEHFRPWTYWSSEVAVSCVIELPAGTIQRTGTRVGDRVILPPLSSRDL